MNANAWGRAIEDLRNSAADICVHQETKLRGQDNIATEQDKAKVAGWNCAVHQCDIGDGGGTSAGVGISTRRHIGMAEQDGQDMNEIKTRFMIQKVGAICNGGVHIGAVYLHDMIGPSDPNNIAILEQIALSLKMISGPWILGGDFTCTPEELQKSNWLGLIGGVIQAPKDPTCDGKRCDFFILKKDLCQAAQSVHTIADGQFHPHSPARIFIKAAPRSMMVEKMDAPRGFPSVLPFGPERLSQVMEAKGAVEIGQQQGGSPISIEDETIKWIQMVESQLVQISDLTNEQAAKQVGRGDGPTTVMT